MYLDSHAHLEEQHFGSDLNSILQRAQAAGVKVILAVGNGSLGQERHLESIANAAKYDFLYSAVGVHPHEAGDCDERFLEQLKILARQEKKVVAWGEIGLDYHYDFSPRRVQQQVFEKQLQAAHDLGLPVVVHSREAEADTLEMLRPWVGSRPWGVLHCFSGGKDFAQKGLDLGMYLSFSGIITFKKAQELRDIASCVPVESLLVESDCPYLAPVPHRGKRNEPAWVTETTALLAQLRGMDLQELQGRLMENFCRLFDVTVSSGERKYGRTTE